MKPISDIPIPIHMEFTSKPNGTTVFLKTRSQLLQYKTIVKKCAPNYSSIKCYLVGNTYDEAVRDTDLEEGGFFLRSFSEIIEEARNRYREIIQILEHEKEDRKIAQETTDT